VCHDLIQKDPGQIITKFNFNRLFSQAWLRTVSPSNLIVGFKTSEVYPFDNRAVQSITVGKSGEDSAAESSKSVEDVEEISPELEKKFVRRSEEGYDLHDPVYTC